MPVRIQRRDKPDQVSFFSRQVRIPIPDISFHVDFLNLPCASALNERALMLRMLRSVRRTQTAPVLERV
jgi:hypothetical protein